MKNGFPSRPHGAILDRIDDAFSWLLREHQPDIFVRERGFTRFARETQSLFKVVGVIDMAAYHYDGSTFDEIAPLSVKKLVAGSGKAGKEEVAEALSKYVGEHAYACDDESDAVAVGIAWL